MSNDPDPPLHPASRPPIVDPRAAPVPEGTVGVLYIGAIWRSGSTLLDLMIGQVPGFTAVGELRQIWQKGCIENRPCGCERPFSECPFWTAVGEEAFGGWSALDVRETLRLRRSLDRAAVVPRMILRGGPGRSPDARSYLDALERLMGAISRVSGAAVVVDSSKALGHGLLLRGIPSIDLRLVHLVRDSRGVTHSKQRRVAKRKREGKVSEDTTVSSRAWALRWLSYNTALPRMMPRGAPRALVRYEDLAVAPAERLAGVLRDAGFVVPPEALGFVRNDRLQVGENHIVYGNPMRFARGEIVVRLDEEWKTGMRSRDRRTVTALTFPLLGRYGYPRRMSR